MTVKTGADPARIAEGILGHDHWELPREIIRSVFRPGSRTAVKACHASSKTFTAADCVVIALLLGGDVLTTAPTWDQVEKILWVQIRRAIEDSVFPASEFGQINLTDIVMPSGEVAIGLSTNESTRFQGFHARPDSFLLVIVDEAPGVRSDIFTAIEGISSGGDVRILELGNPTIPSGQFFDIFENESPIWRRFSIDALDSPNLAGVALDDLRSMSDAQLDDNVRPYLVTRRWVRDRLIEWGVDHPEWQARVRGEFPQNADISLIWRSWIDTARQEARYDPKNGPLVAGIDVAGPGEDETVCGVRQGPSLLDARATTQADPLGPVLDTLRPFVHLGLTDVNVDEAGIGYNFIPRLREHLGDSVRVNGINVGEKPSTIQTRERFVNLKAELYWYLRDRFEAGEIAGIKDPVLISQLAGLRYGYNEKNGKTEVETKEKARKRGVKSPDRAEMLMLCYAPPLRGQRLGAAFQASAKR